MKKISTLLVVFTALFLFSQKSQAAKLPIVWGNGQVLSTVQKMPEDFKFADTPHLNIAILHKQFSLFWLPIWNHGNTRYVLATDDEKTFYELNTGELEELETEYNFKLSATPALSIWQKIGGKPIILLLIGLIIWAYIPKKKEDELVESTATTSTTDTTQSSTTVFESGKSEATNNTENTNSSEKN